MRFNYVYSGLALALCIYLLPGEGHAVLPDTVREGMVRGPNLPGLTVAPGARWKLQPHGKTWADLYSPSDREVFMDFGNNVAIEFQTPSRADLFLFLNMRSQAGYQYSSNPSAPQTPVDLLHQIWQQALGVSLNYRVPLHVFIMRDCNHMLDKSGFDPVVWTDLAVGAGTLAPFRESAYKLWNGSSRPRFFWFVGGGPAIRAGQTSMWSSNSPLMAEGWARGLLRHSLGSVVAVDVSAEGGMQLTDTSPAVRHHLKSELGFQLHSGSGGWRVFAGRRWRDTRFLWPYDQRNYAGLEFIF